MTVALRNASAVRGLVCRVEAGGCDFDADADSPFPRPLGHHFIPIFAPLSWPPSDKLAIFHSSHTSS